MDLQIQAVLHQYHHYTNRVYSEVINVFPRFDNWNRFDKFVLLNMTLLILFFVAQLWKAFSIKKIKKSCSKLLFKLPFIKAKVEKDLKEMKVQVVSGFPEQCKTLIKEIPYKVPDIVIGDTSDRESLKGYLSGSRYPLKHHSDFIMGLASKFSFSNPLHIDIFTYVKQMQVEVIHMCARMLNFTNQKGLPVGSFNSGGTESIMLCIIAYREYKLKHEGVRNPNLVVCKTGHIAALKACEYFGIEARVIGYNKNYEMDVKQMKKNIDSNTICVYTSYPNYPYGNIDPIDQISAICKKKNIPVHVDMCLGGFLVPFLDSEKNSQKGFKLPDGVTSVSLDPHKYGLSSKGASISLFSDQKYRNCHFFTTIYWPGGLYGTTGFAGSRSGTPIAASWISMMKMGEEGYRKSAKQVQDATILLATELRKLGFNVYGEPRICCIGFDHPKYSLSAIQKFIKNRHLEFSLNQKPMSFHFSFTPLNSTRVNEMVQGFKECIKSFELDPPKKQKDSGMLELYGACAKIPDGDTIDYLMCNLIDCYIDL